MCTPHFQPVDSTLQQTTHTYTHAHIHTYRHKHICTYTHIHTYAHTHIHTYTHAHLHTYTHALLWSLRRLQYHHIRTYLKTSHDRFTFFQYSFAAATIKSSFASPHSTDRHLVQWELRLVMLPVFKDNVKNFKVAPCFNSVYDMSHPSKRAMETINVTVVAMDRNKCRAIACIKNRIQCRRT